MRLPADAAFGVMPTERLAVGSQPVHNLVPVALVVRVVDDHLLDSDGSRPRRNLSLEQHPARRSGSNRAGLGNGNGGSYSRDGKWVSTVPVTGSARAILVPTGVGTAKEISIALEKVAYALLPPDDHHIMLTGAEHGHAFRCLCARNQQRENAASHAGRTIPVCAFARWQFCRRLQSRRQTYHLFSGRKRAASDSR